MEKKFFQDAADGKLDQFSYLEAALIASGVKNKRKINYFLKVFDQLHKQLANLKDFNTRTSYQKSELILIYLHKIMFKKYRIHASQLDRVFRKGEFNCVSSAIIYNALCQQFGIPTKGVLVPDHVFSMLSLKEKLIDVETTTVYGFDPEGKNRGNNSFQKLTGFQYYGQSEREYRHVLTNIQLIATIYSNRAAFSKNDFNYARGIENSIKALIIYPRLIEAKNNLKANYVNWAAYLNKKRKFPLSLKVLKEGLTIFANDKHLVEALKITYQSYALYLTQTKNFDKALLIIRFAQQDFPHAKRIQSTFLAIYNHYWHHLILQHQYERALSIIENGKEELEADRFFSLMEVDSYSKWAYFYLKKKDYDTALRILTIALNKFPYNNKLKESKHLIYLIKAENYMKRKQFNMGKVFFDNYFAQYPDDSKMKEIFVNFIMYFTQLALKKKNIRQAIEYALLGHGSFSKNKKIINNLILAYFRKIQYYIRQNDFEEGQKTLDNLISKIKSPKKLNDIKISFYILVYQNSLKKKKIEQEILYLSKEYYQSINNKKILSEMLNNLLNKKLIFYRRKKLWQKGFNYITNLEKFSKLSTVYTELKKDYLFRWLQFLYKKKYIKKGLEICQLGVKLYPKETRFLEYSQLFKKLDK